MPDFCPLMMQKTNATSPFGIPNTFLFLSLPSLKSLLKYSNRPSFEKFSDCSFALSCFENLAGLEVMTFVDCLQLVRRVYNLLNKTRISCGKISETFWENVEAYLKTTNNKSVYFEKVET